MMRLLLARLRCSSLGLALVWGGILVLGCPLIAQAQSDGAWVVTPARFEQSMSMTAAVTIEGAARGAGADQLVAFVRVDDTLEVRGVVTPQQAGGRPVFFLTIYGNATDEGRALVLKYYDASEAQTTRLSAGASFSADAVLGSPGEPLLLVAPGGGSQDPLDWVVDPAAFDQSMTVTGALRLDGQITSSTGASGGSSVRRRSVRGSFRRG